MNPHCSMAMSAEHSSKLEPFTGNGDVSEWVKNSRVGRNTINKPNKRLEFLKKLQKYRMNVSWVPYLLQ